MPLASVVARLALAVLWIGHAVLMEVLVTLLVAPVDDAGVAAGAAD